MIKSMTGYGKAENSNDSFQCQVEVRSVNHRFLDLKTKLPKDFLHLEEALKREVKNFCDRGKVDLHISFDEGQKTTKDFIKESTLKSIKDQVQAWETTLGRTLEIRLSDMLQLKTFFEDKEEKSDFAEQESLITQTVKDALKNLVSMRTREGELIIGVVKEHLANSDLLIKKVPLLNEDVIRQYQNRLQKNLELLDVNFNESDSRIIQELGIISDRCDVTEEVNRFQAHLQHLAELLEAEKPVGRKLDFLMQELNREANTLCSKGNNTEVVSIGVNLKCEVEKMREQILNIE